MTSSDIVSIVKLVILGALLSLSSARAVFAVGQMEQEHLPALGASNSADGDEAVANSSRLAGAAPVLEIPTQQQGAALSAASNLHLEPEQLLVQANQAYENGNFAAAVKGYEALVQNGVQSGRVYYNLGNAFLRKGSLGRAIAAYLRASHYSPRDEDLRANLAFARRSTKDALDPPQTTALWRTLLFWHYSLGWSELCWSLGVTNVLFWCILGVRLLRKDSELLGWATWTLAIPLLALSGSWAFKTLAPRELAVVTSQELAVFAGTSQDSVLRFKLHEGSEALVLDQQGDWAMIALSDGKRGWVKRDQIEEVTMGGWRRGW